MTVLSPLEHSLFRPACVSFGETRLRRIVKQACEVSKQDKGQRRDIQWAQNRHRTSPRPLLIRFKLQSQSWHERTCLNRHISDSSDWQQCTKTMTLLTPQLQSYSFSEHRSNPPSVPPHQQLVPLHPLSWPLPPPSPSHPGLSLAPSSPYKASTPPPPQP